MKQIFIFATILLLGMQLYAQNNLNTKVDDVFYIKSGVVSFHGDLDVTSNGSFTNEGGHLILEEEVIGESQIKIDENADLTVNKGLFTFSQEQNEKLKNLTIGSVGRVAITPGNSLEVGGVLDNLNQSAADSSAGINLYADSLGYGQFLLSGSFNNKGMMYAQQHLTSTATAGWRELSSPVDATLADVADDYPLYFQSNGAPRQWNVWWYDASPIGASNGGTNAVSQNSIANANHYTPVPNPSEPFNSSKAYSIFVGGRFFPEITEDALDARGEFGHGSYSYDVYKTHDMGYNPTVAAAFSVPAFDGDASKPESQITGWNLIPNPYPCNIDVPSLFTSPSGLGNKQYKAVHIWDATKQVYQAIGFDGVGTVVDWNNDGSVVNSNVPPFQAFWIKEDLFNGGGSATETGVFVLENSNRTLTHINSFFKTIPTHISLRVRNSDTTQVDATVVALASEYDNGLDLNDALKMGTSNQDSPQLSSLLEEHELSINRIGLPSPSHAIPLKFKSNKQNELFFLDINEFEVDLSWDLQLFDWHTQILHDFRLDGVYEFQNDTSFEQPNRFTFYINKKDAGKDPLNNVNIWGSREGIEVSFANQANDLAVIEIMDLTGRRLFMESNVATNTNFVWPVINSEPKMYIVRVSTVGNHSIKRVVR